MPWVRQRAVTRARRHPVARADDASTTTPTPSASSTQGTRTRAPPAAPLARRLGPRGFATAEGRGIGRASTSQTLATKLGVDETKLADALKAVRDELRAARTPVRGNATRPDPATMQDELATKLAGRLGIDAAKVKAAFADLRAAHEATEQKAFDDRLAQAVKDGKLTQAEADAVKKAAKAGVIDMHGGPR